MNPLLSAKFEMIESAGRTAQSFGINRLLGQLYMFLFMQSEACCLDDIVASLGVSKASVSIACRQLESWGAVRRVWKKGDRKDYYEPVTDFGQILNSGLVTSLNKKLQSAQMQIERSRTLLAQAESAPEERAFVEKRLAQAEKYRARFETLLNNPLIRKML